MKTFPHSSGLLVSVLCATWSLTAGAAVLNANGVQTGEVTMPVGSTTATVAITSVTTSKAFVICYPLISDDGNGPVASEDVTCELPSTPTSTTLIITNGAADDTETVRWYVVEFLSGVTVQRGLVPTTTYASGVATVDVAISAVNLAKTFVLISATTASGTDNRDEEFTPTAQLTSTTNLQLTRSRTGIAFTVAWQVIQIDSAVVQSGAATIAPGTNSITATLSPPIDINRTFLVFTANGGSQVNGREARYLTTGYVSDATTLTFARAASPGGANRGVNIQWFAVRMTDGTTVQQIPALFSTTDPNTTTVDFLLGQAIAINRSVPFLSVSGDSTTGSSQDIEDNSWAPVLTSSTNLQLTKSTTAMMQANTTFSWQVVQFNDKPNLVDGDGQEIFP
jgi:hypothetical protein